MTICMRPLPEQARTGSVKEFSFPFWSKDWMEKNNNNNNKNHIKVVSDGVNFVCEKGAKGFLKIDHRKDCRERGSFFVCFQADGLSH